jgi:hypothetical protein
MLAVLIFMVVAKIAGNVQGLLLRWYSMFLSPERQPSSEPKAEDNYKS